MNTHLPATGNGRRYTHIALDVLSPMELRTPMERRWFHVQPCKRKSLESAKHHGKQVAPYFKNRNLELLLDKDSWSFANVNATIMSSRIWPLFFFTSQNLVLSEPFGSLVCPFDDFFLDYALFGSAFVAFAFLLCTANCKVALMLNFLWFWAANKRELKRDPRSFERDPGTPNTLIYPQMDQAKQAHTHTHPTQNSK